MGSVNSTKRGSIDREYTRLQTLGSSTHRILQFEAYLIVRATSTVPRLSHASQQANSRAYKPRRVLQTRAAFSVFFLDHGPVLLDAGDITLSLEWTPASTVKWYLRRKAVGRSRV